jgi:hypothetical protein
MLLLDACLYLQNKEIRQQCIVNEMEISVHIQTATFLASMFQEYITRSCSHSPISSRLIRMAYAAYCLIPDGAGRRRGRTTVVSTHTEIGKRGGSTEMLTEFI